MLTIETTRESGVQTISINNPPVNALDQQTILSLLSSLQEASTDDAIRCIILTGSRQIFCAGHDINEMLTGQSQQVSYREHLLQTYNPLILQIRKTPKPIIASINGPAAGAGLGIALACDLRIASENSRFTVGFAGIGLVPDSGVSLFLPLLVGLGRAAELAFSNATIPASQALDWGLINKMTTIEQLPSESAYYAARLANGPTGTYGLTKQAFNMSVLHNLENALDQEAHLQELASKSEEHRLGVKSFLNK
ncbi:MAG TPA: enoyl-CoA hydratase-related protein [Anaerolineales bacterium]|nr:enoyl-CoA hydratase-related protein [Anaerolineales bacterium]